jgi:hypothetical protein
MIIKLICNLYNMSDFSISIIEMCTKALKINSPQIYGKIIKIKNIQTKNNKIEALFYIKIGNKHNTNQPYVKIKQTFSIPVKKFNEINDTKKILLKYNGKKYEFCDIDEYANGYLIFVICIFFIGIVWCIWMIYRRHDYFKNKLLKT